MDFSLPWIDWDEFCEKHNLTLLHRSVCGLGNHNLEAALKAQPADIDSMDWFGRSPLGYAVQRMHTCRVRLLLERGADPNLENILPLAIRSENLEIMEDLLNSGASFDPVSENLQEQWQNSIYGGEKLMAIDRLLLKHNIDVNSQTKDGKTILMRWSQKYSPNFPLRRMEQLIDYGASVDMVDENGMSAIYHAVLGGNSEAFKFLVQQGARLDIKMNRDDNILHVAIMHSEHRDVIIGMSNVDLSSIDLKSRNEDGYIAFDLLKLRNGLRWESYYQARAYERGYARAWSTEKVSEVISSLEALLHQIQDSQGVPKSEQYPPLGPYLSSNTDEEPMPGAWPV